VCQRISVQQQQWWAIAAVPKVDARPTGLDLGTYEPFEHLDLPLGRVVDSLAG